MARLLESKSTPNRTTQRWNRTNQSEIETRRNSSGLSVAIYRVCGRQRPSQPMVAPSRTTDRGAGRLWKSFGTLIRTRFISRLGWSQMYSQMDRNKFHEMPPDMTTCFYPGWQLKMTTVSHFWPCNHFMAHCLTWHGSKLDDSFTFQSLPPWIEKLPSIPQ